MLVAYPVSFPSEAAKSLIAIVKSKDIAKNKVEFALAVWNVQGYIQSKAVSADGTISFTATASIHNLEDAVATAEMLDTAHAAFGSMWTDAALVALKPLVKWALTQVINSL